MESSASMAAEIARDSKRFLGMGGATGERVGVGVGEGRSGKGKGAGDVSVDAKGKRVNPYIPQFIAKAPWYADDGSGESLGHQHHGISADANAIANTRWYTRGAPARRRGGGARWQAGGCDNCGARTHVKADCLERPRKRGARWDGGGGEVGGDDVVEAIDLSWDVKRDLANGYDFAHHTARIQALQSKQHLPQKPVPGTIAELLHPAGAADGSGGAGAQAAEVKQPMRLREDTAGYLRPGEDSADYNPKSRSMGRGGRGNVDGAFERGHKTAEAFEKDRVFAWDARAAVFDKDRDASSAAGQVDGDASRIEEARAKAKALEARYGAPSAGARGGTGTVKKSLPRHLIDRTASAADQASPE
ncbi:mRNA splicing protein [Savitreella phatthalungensis]